MSKIDDGVNDHSGKSTKDYSLFCEGDVEPTLNKKINTIIDCAVEYIVYIDDDNFVQWSYTDAYAKNVPKSFGDTANRLGHLETLSRTQLRKSQLYNFACMLAESMARIIGDRDSQKANEALKRAESYLHTRGNENARLWFIIGSSAITFPTLFIFVILWFNKWYLMQFLEKNTFDVLLGTLFGSCGALFSLLSRGEEINIDPAAGAQIHYLEGAARIIAGMFGAMFIALAFKSNILLGYIKDSNHPFAVLLVLCFIAGSSERFVDGFIKRIDKTSNSLKKGKS